MLRSTLTKIASSTPLVIVANATIKELYGYSKPELDEASTFTNVMLSVYESTGEVPNANDREFVLGLLQDRFDSFSTKIG